MVEKGPMRGRDQATAQRPSETTISNKRSDGTWQQRKGEGKVRVYSVPVRHSRGRARAL